MEVPYPAPPEIRLPLVSGPAYWDENATVTDERFIKERRFILVPCKKPENEVFRRWLGTALYVEEDV